MTSASHSCSIGSSPSPSTCLRSRIRGGEMRAEHACCARATRRQGARAVAHRQCNAVQCSAQCSVQCGVHYAPGDALLQDQLVLRAAVDHHGHLYRGALQVPRAPCGDGGGRRRGRAWVRRRVWERSRHADASWRSTAAARQQGTPPCGQHTAHPTPPCSARGCRPNRRRPCAQTPAAARSSSSSG